MNIKILSPKQSLNKAFQKVTLHKKDYDLFKVNLNILFENIDPEESEENVKNHLKIFLEDTYYKGKNLINTKDRTDLVIYLGNKQGSKAGVLIEVKNPNKNSEMPSKDNLNVKALHQLILYYLEERIERKNNDIKYIIATNIYEWFIFDAVLFENIFYKNKTLVNQYEEWKNKTKVSGNTDLFYNEIVKPFLNSLESEIAYTYFNFGDYKKLLNEQTKESEKIFIPLYKILSPIHLLKQSFANDSNSLDRNFYNELLHIIGLEEVKEKNKKVIRRKNIADRDVGSILENTILILKTDNAISKIKETERYGGDIEDQLFNISLDLTLTWINRILFLKLLESQLHKYHDNEQYRFLNRNVITDFQELYKLFHQVLAVKTPDRPSEIQKKFAWVPYLNSALFEITDLENITIKISSLDNNSTLQLYKATVLKDKSGKRKKESLPVLYYLFEFLDAYNFTSEGKEEIEEEKKTLINASVLGLIFEKINGYKEGSYFTPGFITMYMCKETIRRAIIQKFDEKYKWNCESFDDLKNNLVVKRNTKDILEANMVIDSIKICDPAVGSGHFLVSALNEIIAIKSELGIIADEKGVILKGYGVKIENDELIVTSDDGEEIFEYKPLPIFILPVNSTIESQMRRTNGVVGNTQRVQEILFHEKQKIIENSLFGVDINPNSVKIAQLRLWIELLKNAYYTKESGYTELETLPNIDINIKEGNSLISRFDIKKDLFSETDKRILEIYKINVALYKKEHNREKRREIKNAIETTKERIKGFALDPVKKEREQIDSIVEKLHKLNSIDLFDNENSVGEKELIEQKRLELIEKINKLTEQKNKKAEEYRTLYINTFEWRFEFPEVLDENGIFVGFSVVIGNPPYIFGGNEGLSVPEKKYYKEKYYSGRGKVNLFAVFIERSLQIMDPNYWGCLIIPNTFLRVTSYYYARKYLLENYTLKQIVDFGESVFEDAITTSIVLLFKNNKLLPGNKIEIILKNEKRNEIIQNDLCKNDFIISTGLNNDNERILNKINLESVPLGDIIKELIFGIVITKNRNMVVSKTKIKNWKPFLEGRDIGSYYIKPINKYINYDKRLLHRPRSKEVFEVSEKLLIQRITGGNKPLKAAYDDRQLYNKESINNLIMKGDSTFLIKYILALLNSRLINWFYAYRFTNQSKLTVNLSKEYLSQIPIKKVNKKEQKVIIEIVDKILTIKDNKYSSNVSELESDIDKIVYKLYGLTEEEKEIVEKTNIN